MKKELIAELEPKSPISEVFRTLRTNIQFMNTKGKLKTILITSTFPGEGKSWVASNLAVTFAQAGKKVVLIDADMRKGRQYTIFGISPIPGLSNYLSGIDMDDEERDITDIADYIQDTEIDNLFVMPAGNIPPNPSELLISPQMVNLLEQLKELCDIVIIDGTPNELVTDSLIITRLVDSTIIVTASKQTKKDNLRRAIQNIQNVGGNIAGVVVNKVPIAAKKYEQSYYYGSTELNKARSDMKKAMRKSVNSSSRSHTQSSSSRHTESKEKNMQQRTSNSNSTKVTNNQNRSYVVNNDFNEDKNNESNSGELQRNIKVNTSSEASLEKTNDILKQINEYIDREKKNLK